MEIQGSASTGLPGGFTVVEDTKTEEIETGVAVFECRVKFGFGEPLAAGGHVRGGGNYRCAATAT